MLYFLRDDSNNLLQPYACNVNVIIFYSESIDI